MKGLQNLARQLLSASENGSGEDGHFPSSHGHLGNVRNRFQRDKTDDSGLSPVATFLLHRSAFSPWLLNLSHSFLHGFQRSSGHILVSFQLLALDRDFKFLFI